MSFTFTESFGTGRACGDLGSSLASFPKKGQNFLNSLFPFWNLDLQISVLSISFWKDAYLSNWLQAFQVLPSTGNVVKVQLATCTCASTICFFSSMPSLLLSGNLREKAQKQEPPAGAPQLHSLMQTITRMHLEHLSASAPVCL